MFKHILIPTDGSAISNEAARAGVELAKILGARVTAFFAAPAPTPVIYSRFIPVGITSPEEHARMIEKAATEYLSVVESAAQALGVPCQALHKTDEFPADAILETAREQGCDCIFLASHGHRRRHGPTLGSQTQKVASEARVPVVIYKVEAAGSWSGGGKGKP